MYELSDVIRNYPMSILYSQYALILTSVNQEGPIPFILLHFFQELAVYLWTCEMIHAK
jgi:hypothetical protein